MRMNLDSPHLPWQAELNPLNWVGGFHPTTFPQEKQAAALPGESGELLWRLPKVWGGPGM